jgi:hypothetical protein
MTDTDTFAIDTETSRHHNSGAAPALDADFAAALEFAARASDIEALRERTYAVAHLLAAIKLCKPFAPSTPDAAVHIYPDGTAVCSDDVSAIWLRSFSLRGLDICLPLDAQLAGSFVEAVADDDAFDLASSYVALRLLRATSLRPTVPDRPRSDFAVCYSVAAARGALAENPDREVWFAADEDVPCFARLGRGKLELSRHGWRAPTTFAGRAARAKLLTVLANGPRTDRALEIEFAAGGCRLHTTVEQRVGGMAVTVTRSVFLRAE